MYFYERVKQLHDPAIPTGKLKVETRTLKWKNDQRFVQLRAEVIEEIQAKIVPETVLTNVNSQLH